jgi:lipopolysaccharide transport protein LptA
MATATDIVPVRERTRRFPRRLEADKIRARAFQRARRHSALVRILRIGFPIASVVFLGSYGLFVQRSISVGEGKLTVGPVSLSTEYLTMHAPRYEGYNTDGSHYVVNAKSAVQNLKQQNEIKLNDIDGKLSQTNNAFTTLTAVRGNYDSKANELELFENINVKSSDGMTALLSRAKIYIKENRIVSEEPVDVLMTTGTLRGNSMVLLQKSHEVTFSNGVTAKLKVPPRTDKPSVPEQPSALRRMTSSDEPVEVTSPHLKIDDLKKTALFSGGVRAVQGEAVLTSSELEANYEGNADPASPQSRTAAAAGPGGGTHVKRLFARDNVILTRGPDRVASDTGEFDTANETSILLGRVVFTSGADRQANGDRADIDSKSDTVLLTGDVTIIQGKNVLKGRRLFFDQKNGTSLLTSPPDIKATVGTPNRITARLYQTDAKPAKPKATAANDANPLKFNTDPTAPIDIEAEMLDTNDAMKAATFRGKVLAVQGDFKLRTSELTATYTGSAGLTVGGAGADPAKSPAQIQKIHASKKVLVTSKDNQSASGDWADVDVKSNTITLGGDVVLNQARNIVRGPKLVIDMVTGEYRMETGRQPGQSPPASTASTSGGPVADSAAGGTPKSNQPPGQIPNIMAGSGPTACGGRMCLLIYPKELKDAAAQGASGLARTIDANKQNPGKRPETPPQSPKSDDAPEATSSWSPTVRP